MYIIIIIIKSVSHCLCISGCFIRQNIIKSDAPVWDSKDRHTRRNIMTSWNKLTHCLPARQDAFDSVVSISAGLLYFDYCLFSISAGLVYFWSLLVQYFCWPCLLWLLLVQYFCWPCLLWLLLVQYSSVWPLFTLIIACSVFLLALFTLIVAGLFKQELTLLCGQSTSRQVTNSLNSLTTDLHWQI